MRLSAPAGMDHYEILGLSRDADAEQIKNAWRQAQIRWHPDKNLDDPKTAEERFKDAGEAYEVLSNPDKRRIYDIGIHINPDGTFDASAFDPSKLNQDDLIKSFVRLFSVYIDERIPGFREAAKTAAYNVEKAQSQKNDQKKARREKKKPKEYSCTACKDTKRIKMRQGNFEISVGCRHCESVN